MKCQRCWRGAYAAYRVRSDVIDMKVCAACAEEAKKLGMIVEILEAGAGKGTGESKFNHCNHRSEFSSHWR